MYDFTVRNDHQNTFSKHHIAMKQNLITAVFFYELLKKLQTKNKVLYGVATLMILQNT